MESAAVNAAEALKAARSAGIRLGIDGDDLTLEAPTAPHPIVLDQLARHKAGVMALLRSAGGGWSGEDWLAFFDERAGIGEFDGGLSRDQAEARAFAACVAEWLNRHPAPSVPRHCAWCHKAESFDSVVLPFGTEPGTHTWLHSNCWQAWHAARRTEAIAVLAAIGINQPRTTDDREERL
jgi:hypothetical protein